jgi:hypothetical protein
MSLAKVMNGKPLKQACVRSAQPRYFAQLDDREVSNGDWASATLTNVAPNAVMTVLLEKTGKKEDLGRKTLAIMKDFFKLW